MSPAWRHGGAICGAGPEKHQPALHSVDIFDIRVQVHLELAVADADQMLDNVELLFQNVTILGELFLDV